MDELTGDRVLHKCLFTSLPASPVEQSEVFCPCAVTERHNKKGEGRDLCAGQEPRFPYNV